MLNTLEDNDRFCAFMQDTLDRHQVVIPEVRVSLSAFEITANEALLARYWVRWSHTNLRGRKLIRRFAGWPNHLPSSSLLKASTPS